MSSYETNSFSANTGRTDLNRDDFGRSDQAGQRDFLDDNAGRQNVDPLGGGETNVASGGFGASSGMNTGGLTGGYDNQGGIQDRARGDEFAPQNRFAGGAAAGDEYSQQQQPNRFGGGIGGDMPESRAPQNYGYGQGSTGGGSEEDIYGEDRAGQQQRQGQQGQAGKASMMDKVKGVTEIATGEVTRNKEKVAQGEARKV